MNGNDINKALLILFLFSILYLVNILSVGLKRIKDNWPLYKCNPVVLPFANLFGKDTITNFVECVQTMQSFNMDKLLKPLTSSLSSLSSIGTSFNDSIYNLRNIMNTIRDKILIITKDIYKLFHGIITEIQLILGSVKTIASRISSILTVFLETYQISSSLVESGARDILNKFPFKG
jgi:hypothetical protein